MTHVRHAQRADPLSLLRVSLTALTALGIAGTAFELATLHHWNGAIQLVPWAALAVLAAALALHLAAPSYPPQLHVVRVLALFVLAAALYGVVEHALANYRAGPLDQRFADTWTTLVPWLRWWYAITKTVGPAPTLAPGMLGHTAATLILATIGRRVATPTTQARRRHRYSRSIHHPGVRHLEIRHLEMTYGRPGTVAATASRPRYPAARRLDPATTIAASPARTSPRRASGRPPSRHRLRRW